MQIVQATKFPAYIEVLVDWDCLLVEARYNDGNLVDSSFLPGSDSEKTLDKFIKSKLSGKL